MAEKENPRSTKPIIEKNEKIEPFLSAKKENSANQSQTPDKLQRYLDQPQLIVELEHLVEQCFDHKLMIAGILNCQLLLQISERLRDIPRMAHFGLVLKRLKSLQTVENSKLQQEHQEIQKQLDALTGVIDIDPLVASGCQDLSLNDLGIDESQLTSLVQNADQLLKEHRVAIKQEVFQDTVYRTESGKTIQIHQITTIQSPKSDISEGNLDDSRDIPQDWIVEHTLTNNDKDPIDEAFLDDIIPYNYEISEIELNNQPVDIPDDHQLRKDGLEVQWFLKDLKDTPKIHLKYRLHPRVSRTVLLPLPSKLQVIHTHSSIDTPETTAESSTIQTHLTFRNKFTPKLNIVTMEDIIPPLYQFQVEEKKTGEFSSSKTTQQNLVKWNLFEIPLNQSSRHDYQLTEVLDQSTNQEKK